MIETFFIDLILITVKLKPRFHIKQRNYLPHKKNAKKRKKYLTGFQIEYS